MNLNRMSTRPIDTPRSLRRHGVRALTSMPAGRVVPIAAVPLLREDAVRRGTMQFKFEMSETAEVLMNSVHVDVKAYLVPWLAFERFGGSMDILNRSYMGQPPMTGEALIPFVETHALGAHGSKPIYKYLGLHGKSTDLVNTMYAESYNLIQNFRAANRSPNIPKRARLDTSLAPAFWKHSNFAHIVPDWDDAAMDGHVALNVVNAKLPVKGIAAVPSVAFTTAPVNNKDSTGAVVTGSNWAPSSSNPFHYQGNNTTKVPDIFAEMQQNGITISLASIEQAKKTQAYARIREQYAEHSEEWIIDMLMSGLSVPDQALKQPMLLAESSNIFGMNKRYSTDAAALTASAVNGFSMAEMTIRVPRLATGGVIMVIAEVVPEQLWERQKDPFFHLQNVAALPDWLRDDLDTQKVVEVRNDFVDTDHATPAGIFGYAPLGHEWSNVRYNVGGKFFRPTTNTVEDEERQRIWASETVNPALSADFYLCNTIHQKPFLDQVADPFEAVAVGEFAIEGNTVLGPLLVEAMNNYQAVMDKAPTDQIVKP